VSQRGRLPVDGDRHLVLAGLLEGREFDAGLGVDRPARRADGVRVVRERAHLDDDRVAGAALVDDVRARLTVVRS